MSFLHQLCTHFYYSFLAGIFRPFHLHNGHLENVYTCGPAETHRMRDWQAERPTADRHGKTAWDGVEERNERGWREVKWSTDGKRKVECVLTGSRWRGLSSSVLWMMALQWQNWRQNSQNPYQGSNETHCRQNTHLHMAINVTKSTTTHC